MERAVYECGTHPWHRPVSASAAHDSRRDLRHAGAPRHTDQGGDQTRDPHRLHVGLGQVAVQFVQMEDRQQHAHYVDEDPQHVQHVVSEGSVHQRTGG